MKYKKLIRDVIVAILSAILTFLTTTSCQAVWIKGSDCSPVIDYNSKVSADSTNFVKFRV